MKSTRHSEQTLLNKLYEAINGKSFTIIASELNYGVPFISTKLKQLAIKYNLEQDLNTSLNNQKLKRINKTSFSNKSINYLNSIKNIPCIWKSWNGYDISSTGLVKHNNKFLSYSFKETNFTTYARVVIFISGRRYYYSVHRLVLEVFNPNPNSNFLQVDHIDGNGLNNDINNLRWCTGSENINYSFITNSVIKKGICSKGGKISGKILRNRAIIKYSNLLKNRFISYNANATITYQCKCCNQILTEPNTARAFRYGNDGICGKCRKTYEPRGE